MHKATDGALLRSGYVEMNLKLQMVNSGYITSALTVPTSGIQSQTDRERCAGGCRLGLGERQVLSVSVVAASCPRSELW